MRVIKSISVVLILIIIISVFSGCRLNHYSEDEIVQWAKENIGSPIYISSGYTEREGWYDEKYTDRVWKAYLPDMPELEFEIISHEYWGFETITHSIGSTYGYVYGKYYFEQYCKENRTDFVPTDNEPSVNRFYVHAYFDDRENIGELMEQAKSIKEYMAKIGVGKCISFEFELNDALADVDDTDVHVFAGCEADMDKVESEILTEYAQYSADYRIDVEQFTNEELKAATEQLSGCFEITRPDGTVVSYSDLSLSRFSYGMSFGCMYEVFSREGLDVEGTPEHFYFNGIDGSSYEFSYSFNDYEYSDGKVGYYYIKDGVKTPMNYYFYNHFRSGFIEEISGLSFEQLYF